MPDHAVRVVAYRSLEEAAPLAAQLDAINAAARRPSPFDTFAYLETFLAHDEFRPAGQELLLLVAFEGERPIGFLPLCKARERFLGRPCRTLRFLVAHDNDRPHAVARPDDEARCCSAFYRHLLHEERGWSYLQLIEQDADSKLLDLPPELARRFWVRRWPTNPNSTIPVTHGSLDAFLHAFDKKNRHNVERQARKLLAAGDVCYVSSVDPEARGPLFELYLELEQRSWKARVGGHVARHPERVAFFRKLLEPSQPMEMAIDLLLLDGLPIAGAVRGQFGGGTYVLEVAFDDEYRDLTPGNTMWLLLMREATARGWRFLNLLGNYAYYKSKWQATVTPTEAVQIYRRWRLPWLRARGGDLWKRLHPPPPGQLEAQHNLAKKPVEDGRPPAERAAPARSPRAAERERARAACRALRASGASFEHLEGDALAEALPFAAVRSTRPEAV